MKTTTIGSLTVSVVGLGCNNFGMRMDQAQTKTVVAAALDAGITLFDTADVYGATKSEEFLGAALGSARDDVVVATKFGAGKRGEGGGGHPDYVRECCEASLRRLGTDRIDLYQLHMPDTTTPIADTLGALAELVAEGKVGEIGCSNFNGGLTDSAAKAASDRGVPGFATLQNQLSLLDRRQEADTVASCERHGLALLPYFPLASGLLTGKYERGAAPPEGTRMSMMPEDRRATAMNDRAFDTVDRLAAFAAERGRTLLELAMSWLAGMAVMGSVIAGATKVEQVHANVASVGWDLTDDERAEVDALTAR